MCCLVPIRRDRSNYFDVCPTKHRVPRPPEVPPPLPAMFDRLVESSETLHAAVATPVVGGVRAVKRKNLQEPVTDFESLRRHEPSPAAVARTRIVPQMKTGTHPKSKRDDKDCHVNATTRVRQNPGSGLVVGLNGTSLVCSLCAVDISRYQTSITQHLSTAKHASQVAARVEALKLKEASKTAFLAWASQTETCDRSGVALEGRFNGDTLDPETHAYRLQVTRAWVMAGIPISRLFDKTSGIKDLLQGGQASLTLNSSSQMGPAIRKMEQDRVRKALITCSWVTIIFDGTTAVDEVFTIVIRTVTDDPEHLTIKQWLCAVKWLQYSMSAKQQAALLVRVLLVDYGLDPEKIVFASADACAVNQAALNVIESLGTRVVHLPCVSHGASLAGIRFATPSSTRFVHVWCTIISKRSSPKPQNCHI